MTIQKKTQAPSLTTFDDLKSAENAADRARNYHQEKAKRERRGLLAPSAVEYDHDLRPVHHGMAIG